MEVVFIGSAITSLRHSVWCSDSKFTQREPHDVFLKHRYNIGFFQ